MTPQNPADQFAAAHAEQPVTDEERSNTFSVVQPIERSDEDQQKIAGFTKNESPAHRLMCYMTARGERPAVIAERLGYTPEWVRQVLASPRSCELIAQIIDDANSDSIIDLLAGAKVDAVMELRSLATGAKSETVRLGSIKEILDRTQGKPNNKPQGEKETSLMDEIEAMKRAKAVEKQQTNQPSDESK